MKLTPPEVRQAAYDLERRIVKTLGYEIHGIIQAAKARATPGVAFDQRIRSLHLLIEEVKQLKMLCEEMASWRNNS